MRRRTTTILLIAVMSTAFAGSPVSAQLPGMTTLEPEMIDLGAEPRQELRYHFSEGQTETFGLAMTMDMTAALDGTRTVDMAMSVSAEMHLVVTDVYEDGSARVEQTFSRYEFGDTGDPLVDAELETMAEQFEGLGLWLVVSDRGTIAEYGVDMSGKLSPEIEQQLRDSAVAVQPLPEEPVGVGARWVAAGSMVSQGVPMEMTVETELLELSDDGATFDLSLLGGMDMAAAMVGELPPGFDVSVDRFDMGGGGQMDVRFERLVPTSEASLDLGMAMTVSGTQAGESVTVGMDFDTRVSMQVQPLE
jgi:hypothetical protein